MEGLVVLHFSGKGCQKRGKSFFLGGGCDPHRNYAARLGKTQHLLILPGVFLGEEHLQ